MRDRALIGAYLIALAVITYQEVKSGFDDFGGRGLPLPAPARYVDATVVYGVLGIVAAAAPTLAVALGYGTIVALLVSRANKPAGTTRGSTTPTLGAPVIQGSV